MKPKNIIRLLAFGDIVGDPGRKAIKNFLPFIKDKICPDIIIANGENAAHGFGITEKIAKELFDDGIDIITTGNHIWQKKEIFNFISKYPNLIRPINYPVGTPGNGTFVIEKDDIKIAVINSMGRIFMEPIDCPFQTTEKEIERLKKENINIILVDFHAEASSEKQVFGWYFDGKVSAVWGTHTHIQTSDERILPKKTAYITDIGMCGSIDSVIGMKIEDSYRRVIQHLPVRFSPAEPKNLEVQGVIIDIDRETGKSVLINRLKEKVFE